MAGTRRLYLDGSAVAGFSARVLSFEPCEPAGGAGTDPAQAGIMTAVVLDQTAFYPGGGGQPPDRGLIGGIPVIGVALAGTGEPDTVLHVVAGGQPLPFAPGDVVSGQLDWERRWDFMQQHTGQHILSAVALRACAAPTTGFHLGEEYATVDLMIPAAQLQDPGAADELVAGLERLACAQVFADLEVSVSEVPAHGGPAPAAGLELRVREHGPAPKGGATWRVVEIAGLDRSPCGGTHVGRTGQIGLVTVTHWERIREGLRLEFACGYRALDSQRRRGRDLRRLGAELSVGEREAVDQALRLLAQAESTAKELRAARALLLAAEAAELAAASERVPAGQLVCRTVAGRDPAELKYLAATVAERPGCIALIATDGDVPRLVFARSPELAQVHCGRLMAAAMAIIGGRGGGSPQLAQGGGGDHGLVRAALESAAQAIRTLV